MMIRLITFTILLSLGTVACTGNRNIAATKSLVEYRSNHFLLHTDAATSDAVAVLANIETVRETILQALEEER